MNTNLHSDTVLLKQTGLALIKASGAEAVSFLDGQFSNDLATLDTGHWQLSGYCSAKGRLIAVMRVFKDEDNVYILLPVSIAQAFLDKLRIFVFRAKVSFEVMACSIYCIAGPQAEALCQDFVDSSPAVQEVKLFPGGWTLNLSDTVQRYLIIARSNSEFSITNVIDGEQAEVAWRLSEIEAGIANVYPQTIEKFIPQHVNLDQKLGVSFTKGCFPGQEVVARLHYLGKSKQTMRRLMLAEQSAPSPGDTIEHSDHASKLTVVDAVKSENNQVSCLAVGMFEN